MASSDVTTNWRKIKFCSFSVEGTKCSRRSSCAEGAVTKLLGLQAARSYRQMGCVNVHRLRGQHVDVHAAGAGKSLLRLAPLQCVAVRADGRSLLAGPSLGPLAAEGARQQGQEGQVVAVRIVVDDRGQGQAKGVQSS